MEEYKRLTPEEVKKKLDKIRSGEMKFEMAPTKITDSVRPYIDRVLDVLGHPEALVSDMSSVGDFRPDSDVCSYDDYVKDISHRIGFQVNKGDSIINMALHLMGMDKKGED